VTEPELSPRSDVAAPPVAGRWVRRLAALGLCLVVASGVQLLGAVIDGLRGADAVGFTPPLTDKLRAATQGANVMTGLLVLLGVLLVLLPELISGVVGTRVGLPGATLTAGAAVGAVLVVASVLGLYLQLTAPGSLRALAVFSRLADVIVCIAATWTAFTSLADSRLAPRLGRLAPPS
jgi:hypothetical protein